MIELPNSYVFPGGVSEATDFSPDWLDLIGHKVTPPLKSAAFYSLYSKELPKDSLPVHIGFRICAIRETFEESGVLLVRSLTDANNAKRSAGFIRKVLNDNEIKSWRGKVHADSSMFMHLCRHIECAPDIWSLYEWSNWVTPACNLRRRFNTIFYLAFLDSEPAMSHDGTEVVNSTWINPTDVFVPSLRKMLSMATPQLYEMSRLCRFSTTDDLKIFATSLEGVEKVEAVLIQSKDGDSIYFFPGDDMYEQVKQDSYKHYENIVNITPPKYLKHILPLLQVAQNTRRLLVETKDITNRVAINPKTSLFIVNCTAKLKYDMPTPFEPFTAKL